MSQVKMITFSCAPGSFLEGVFEHLQGTQGSSLWGTQGVGPWGAVGGTPGSAHGFAPV